MTDRPIVAAPWEDDPALAAMREGERGMVERDWIHIDDAIDGNSYMGAFQRTVGQSWAVVGPGRVKAGLFSDHLGDWGAIKAVLKLREIDAQPAAAALEQPR